MILDGASVQAVVEAMQSIARGRITGGVPVRWSSRAAQEIARKTLIAVGLDWSERGEAIRKATGQ